MELFLNSVKLLANLTRDEKTRLLDALDEQSYQPGAAVVMQVVFMWLPAEGRLARGSPPVPMWCCALSSVSPPSLAR